MMPSCRHRCINSFECLTFCERFMIVTSFAAILLRYSFDAIRTELRERGVSGLLSFVLLCASVAERCFCALHYETGLFPLSSPPQPPVLKISPAVGPQWLHEVKFDGCGCSFASPGIASSCSAAVAMTWRGASP